jgi:hypothetical protein
MLTREDSDMELSLTEAQNTRTQSKSIELFRRQNKRGDTIQKTIYAEVALFVVNAINVNPTGEIPLNELIDLAEQNFGQEFHGSVYWYLLKIKEDLESRGIIKRLINRKKLTQGIRLKKKHHQCVAMIAILTKI